MKISSLPLTRVFGVAAMAAVALITLPVQAKDKDKDDDHHKPKHGKSHNDKDNHEHDRQVYSAHPHTSFSLSLGNGYAGRGYYYGPPNSSYYYERPEVRYYATREAAPRAYYNPEVYRSNASDAAVQRALARRGYYQGSIDGELGPQSARAIARYQSDRGLRVTATVTPSLLQSLGLQ